MAEFDLRIKDFLISQTEHQLILRIDVTFMGGKLLYENIIYKFESLLSAYNKSRSFKLLLALLCYVVSFYPLHVLGQSKGRTFILDGKTYIKEQLIDDFLNVAFSDVPWNADAGEEERLKIYEGLFPPDRKLSWWETFFGKEDDRHEDVEQWCTVILNSPVFTKHLLGSKCANQLNRRNVINKWEKNKITIAVGFPFYSNRPAVHEKYKHLMLDKPPFVYDGYEKDFYRFEKIIQKQISDISEAAGLPVEFYKLEDTSKDKTEDYARIRIIPIPVMQNNRTSMQAPGYLFHPFALERDYLNGVLFQSFTFDYIDGYILPDKSLSLDMAICKVNPSLDEPLLSAFINECIVRSLGLPSMSVAKDSVLGSWHVIENDQIDQRFKMFAYKIGDKIIDVNIQSREYYKEIGMAEEAKQMEKGLVWLEIPQDRMLSYQKMSAYDKFLVSILYCPFIKSGMNKSQVKEILQKDDSCFQK